MEDFDKSLERFIIDYYGDIDKLYVACGGKLRQDKGNVMCCFHENTHTPAARIYHDEFGGTLFCFSEHKLYTCYDFYKKLGIDTSKLAKDKWEKLTQDEKNNIISLSSYERDLKELPFLKSLEKFRKGIYDITQLLNDISRILKEEMI